MCFKEIKAFHKKYRKRCRSFYSSSIAGLFTGVMIGILFSLITDSQFNRWINLRSYEFFAAIIYFGFTIFILWVFYYLGKGLFWLILHVSHISNKEDDLIGFKINFIAGIYSAAFSASLILLNNKFPIIIYVTLAFIIFYLLVEYYAVRNKK